MREITLVVLETVDVSLHGSAHRGECAIHPDYCITAHGQFAGLRFQTTDRFGQINVSTFAIEMNAHTWIALRRFDYCGVKRGASNGVDAVLGIDIVRREMQCTGFIMNHPATHRDRVA